MHAWFWFSAIIIFIILFSFCILAAIENQVDKSSQVLSQEYVEAIGEYQILRYPELSLSVSIRIGYIAKLELYLSFVN